MADSDVIFEVRPSQVNNIFYFIGMAVLLGVILFYAREAESFVYSALTWLNEGYIGQSPEKVKLVSMGLMVIAVVAPGMMICWRYLDTHLRLYTFRSDRLVFKFGVINNNKDNVEFYRVKDFYSDAPFWMRPFGLSNFHLISTDRRTPYLKIPGIKGVEENEDKIRNAIEVSTNTGKGREIDIV